MNMTSVKPYFLIIAIAGLFLSFRSEAGVTEKMPCLIPVPQDLKMGEGCFRFSQSTNIRGSRNYPVLYLQEKLNASGLATDPSGQAEEIVFSISPKNGLPEEGYRLEIGEKRIMIESSDNAGAFYAVQTLLQLMPPRIYSGGADIEEWTVPCLEINDYPRFSYRGMMLDVSRTFYDASYIKKHIEWLAYHKINRFHWHLADDNGWRIEIRKHPELTEKGAWRGPDEVIEPSFGSGNKRYGGYYTQKEIREIVRLAAERNIEIIPEIDLPGHSRAIAAVFPEILCPVEGGASVQGETKNVWCVSREENYRLLEDIIKEIASMFPSEYIHLGGDEVALASWKECPSCQKLMKECGYTDENQLLFHFVRRVKGIVEKYGKKLAGWDEIMEDSSIGKDATVYAWRSVGTAEKSVRSGYRTVMQVAEYCYVDMKQSPLERGHNWAGIVTLEKLYSFDPLDKFNFTDEEKENVAGIQGGFWSELGNRPYRFVEYQNYPRTAAIAEIGWSSPESRDYPDFYRRLVTSHYDRMYHQGIAFRLPYPDVKYFEKENAVKVRLPYPSAVVRYTVDGSEPDSDSPVCMSAIVTDSPRKFRFATFFNNDLKSISVGASNIKLFDTLAVCSDVITNMGEHTRFPLSNLKDGNVATYFRSDRKAVPGDYIEYRFGTPLSCSEIIVETGIPDITLYGVTDGYVEYSYNGIDYVKGDTFVDGVAVIRPDQQVKSVRINITGKSDGPVLAVQDLKIVF